MKGLLLASLLTLAALPARSTAPASADCAPCHAEAEPLVKPDALMGSVHEGLSCTDCHSAVKELPHEEDLPPADCSPCHGGEAGEWAAGPHARGAGAPSCAACHGSHQVPPAALPESIRHGGRQFEVCGACHAKRPGPPGHGGGDWILDYKRSAHGEAVLKMGLDVAPSCAACHGAHAVHHMRADSGPAAKLAAAEVCGKCHGQVWEAFKKSIHASALEKGVAAAPTCTDCHGEHTIQGPTDKGSLVSAAAVPKTCGACHADKQAMANIGLPYDRLSTFVDSFHGIALEMGDVRAANCASCHGAHDVQPSSDPASRTNPQNLTKTCGQCHPKAGEGFSKVKFHQAVSPTGARGAWFVRIFYVIFISVLLAGFLLHISAELVGRLKGRGR